MEEIWKDIKGFEGLYMVSNMGNVMSLNYNLSGESHLMSTHIRNGKRILGLRKDKKQYSRSVSHLVAEAFVDNPNNCLYVIHKDGNMENDVAENLMWACSEKKVFGVGVNDVGYVFDENGKECASYRAWSGMLQRCYQEQSLTKRPHYRECSVCDDWLLYSNFKKWFDNPEIEYKKGHRVDKDIIKKGNKIYCPEFCCLVPDRVNVLFTNCNSVRGLYPIGVVKDGYRFCAHMAINGKMTRLGNRATPEEAFLVYKQKKEQYIKDVAQEYFDRGEITKRVYDAMLRYEIDITD